MALSLDGWPAPGGATTVGGSLYALPRAHRLTAAEELAARGWWVHADVLLDEAGTGAGVSLAEVAQVRSLLPGALIEVHLIELGGGDRAVARAEDRFARTLAEALTCRPTRVVLPSARCAPDGDAVRRAREAGAAVWAEVAPRDDVSGDAALGSVDGALVMLIEPGTTEEADLRRLSQVTTLSWGLPVGVDGGVAPDNLDACLRAGATHLVVGRALVPGPGLTAPAGTTTTGGLP